MADQKMDVWALTEWDRPLEKMRQPMPTIAGSDVLLRVTHAGVCHSDLHTAEGFYDVGKGQRFYVKDRGITLPRALGHEICGEVVAVGPDVVAVGAVRAVELGSRQIVYPWLGCAACTRCRQEQDNLCAAQRGLGTLQDGGFAEYVVVPHPKYLVDLGALDPAVACTFGCSGITTLSAVRKVLPLPPDEPVLLIGAGGLGLAAIAVLRSQGHRAIVSADISDDKLAGALAAGASKTVNTAVNTARDAILAATGGPVLAVIDFVNSSATAALVNDGLVAKGATWVQVGVMGGSVELSLVGNIFKGLTIHSNITGNLADLHALVDLAKAGKIDPVPIQKMPWDEVNAAMGLLKAGKVTGRVVLVKK